MIALVISLIIFVIGTATVIFACKGEEKAGSTIFGGIVICLIVSVFLFFVIDFIVFFSEEYTYIEYRYYEEVTETENIYALKDTKEQEGKFFVGTVYGTGGGYGELSQAEYYVVYVQRDKGKQPEKFDAYDDNVYIDDTLSEGEQPHIKYYQQKKEKYLTALPNKNSFILYNKYKDNKVGDTLGTWTYNYNKSVQICVPEGTILENYIIDME